MCNSPDAFKDVLCCGSELMILQSVIYKLIVVVLKYVNSQREIFFVGKKIIEQSRKLSYPRSIRGRFQFEAKQPCWCGGGAGGGRGRVG